MAREQPRRRLTDLRDAERIDEAVKGDAPALVDRGHQVAGAEPAPAFALGNHIGVEPEDVGRLPDQAILPKGGNVLLAHPLYIEAIAGYKMPQPLDRLGGADQPPGAAPSDLTRLAHREAAADRAVVGELIGHGALWAAIGHH